jgi:hypothetical protein
LWRGDEHVAQQIGAQAALGRVSANSRGMPSRTTGELKQVTAQMVG